MASDNATTGRAMDRPTRSATISAMTKPMPAPSAMPAEVRPNSSSASSLIVIASCVAEARMA